MGLTRLVLLEPPALDVPDNGLPTLVNVHVFNGNLPLALTDLWSIAAVAFTALVDEVSEAINEVTLVADDVPTAFCGAARLNKTYVFC
jgi:hypothetical protein